MKSLKLRPELLPESEELVLAPQIRGISGTATLRIQKSASNLKFNVRAQFGMLLFKNALNFEAVSEGRVSGEGWSLSDYLEINHKNGNRRSSKLGLKKAESKFEGQMYLDPLAMLYALRCDPLREIGDARIGYGARGDNPISVEIIAKEIKEKSVKAFAHGVRKLVRIELLIESPKSPDKIRVFGDGKAGLWIDQETNLVTEVGYEIPPFGKLSMVLEKVS